LGIAKVYDTVILSNVTPHYIITVS